MSIGDAAEEFELSEANAFSLWPQGLLDRSGGGPATPLTIEFTEPAHHRLELTLDQAVLEQRSKARDQATRAGNLERAGDIQAAFDAYAEAYRGLAVPGADSDQAWDGLARLYPKLAQEPPVPSAARDALAEAKRELDAKRPMAAMEKAFEAVRWAPWSAAAHYNLSKVYEAAGEKRLAARHLRRFAALAPDAPEAAEARRSLGD